MKKCSCEIWYRVAFIVAHLVLFWGLKGTIAEAKILGEVKFESLNQWGTTFVRYTVISAMLAALVLPLRVAFYASGLAMGGLMVILLGLYRDVTELVKMDQAGEGQLPPLQELIDLRGDGKILVCGILLCVLVIVLGGIKSAIRSFRRWQKKL
ncbi:MAG: hypothetical protein HC845_04985 [Akkermansiaceae bacterium]|nr:hypothetical protein [Akkermansiaceae bacterium]